MHRTLFVFAKKQVFVKYSQHCIHKRGRYTTEKVRKITYKVPSFSCSSHRLWFQILFQGATLRWKLLEAGSH